MYSRTCDLLPTFDVAVMCRVVDAQLCTVQKRRVRFTIAAALVNELPVAHWHEQIGDPNVADSIMDPLVHNAYRIDLNGESMRKQRGRKTDQEPE